MGRTAEYQTRQKQKIIEYLSGHRGDYVTAGELAAFFERSGEAVSLTTVYRHLERLAAEKRVEKYHIEGMKSACFCAVDESEAEGRDSLTMKCQSCGEIVRFSCPDLGHLYEHFEAEHRISIDPRKTLFYGQCDKCSVRQAGIRCRESNEE